MLGKISFIKVEMFCYLALNYYCKILEKMRISLVSCLGLSLTNVKIAFLFCLVSFSGYEFLVTENGKQATMSLKSYCKCNE